MNTPNDTYDSLSPINWLLRVLFLSNVTKIGNQLIIHCPLTKRIIYLITVSFISFILLYINISMEPSTSETCYFCISLHTVFLFGNLEYVINTFLVYFFRFDTLNYFLFYKQIDSLLGAPDFAAIRRSIKNVVIFTISTWFFYSAVDYMTWAIEYGWQTSVLFMSDYLFYLTNSMTVLDLVSHVLQIEYRLKNVVKCMEDYYNLMNQAEGRHHIDAMDPGLGASKDAGVPSLKRGYLLLLDQVSNINKIFGTQLILYSIVNVAFLVHDLNFTIRIALGRFKSEFDGKYLPMFSSTSRIVVALLVTLVLVYRCEQVYRQRHESIRLIDLMLINDNLSTRTRKAFKEFRVLLTSRPLRIHAVNFFNCDYPLLVSIVSTIATYTIILLQSLS